MDLTDADTTSAPPVVSGDVSFGGLPPVEERGPLGAELWLAVGHLRAGAGEMFVSLITMLSVLGVLLGVAVLNIVLSVMSGFEIDLRDKILGANAHVVVMRYGGGMQADEATLAAVEAVPGVRHAAPFVYSEMMIRSAFGTSGVIFKGVDPHRTGEVTAVRDQLVLGPAGALDSDEARRDVFRTLGERHPIAGPEGDEQALPGIILGGELADDLKVVPGDVVQVINPIGGGTGLFGMPTATARRFRVAGVFHSGMYEYDTKWTYVAVDEAASFLKQEGLVTGIEIRVDDIDGVDAIARRIEEALGYPFYARHWRNMNQALFEALALEKIVMGLILGMIIVVAGLLIISNLYMMVITKTREIAILKAMGASSRSILRVFVAIGAVVGVVGAAFGTLLGYAGCRFLAWYQWPLETDVYYLSTLPVVIRPENFVVVAAVALAVCLLSTLYPAWRAASLDPVEGLRYE